MRWMIYVKYMLVITSVILGALVAVLLAYNCHGALSTLDMQNNLPDVGVFGEDSTVFPCEVEGTELVALSLISYEGTFFEDGGDSEVGNIAALLLRNDTDEHIYNAKIKVRQRDRILIFELTHLPGNGKILVIEKNKQPFKGSVISSCEGVVCPGDNNGWTEKISFTPTGQRGLIVKNLTERQLKDIVVHYKTYYQPAGFYVGGITYSVRIDTLVQSEEVQLFPCPFTAEGSAVVWVAVDE